MPRRDAGSKAMAADYGPGSGCYCDRCRELTPDSEKRALLLLLGWYTYLHEPAQAAVLKMPEWWTHMDDARDRWHTLDVAYELATGSLNHIQEVTP